MRRLVVATVMTLGAGCSVPGPSAGDMAAGSDAPQRIGLDLTGRYASALDLQLEVDRGADGGVRAESLRVLTMWTAYQKPGTKAVEVDSTWYLCALPLPGLDVPLNPLSTAKATSQGLLAATDDGAVFSEPEMTFVYGAQLAHPASDPLPSDPARLCSDSVTTGCAVPDANNKMPGLVLRGESFGPDIEYVSVVLRVKFAVMATARAVGTIDGTVPAAAIEARVLGCRRKSGVDCGAETLGRIEAGHPQLKVTGGKLRSHVQGFYFTCAQFLGDPEGALTGIELLDGGVGDQSLGGATFSTAIQNDLDGRGCATGGCHDAITGPGKMHLVFQPETEALRRQNYEAVLPWTQGSMPGGRFVNEVPLPAAMRGRWMQWIAEGARY